MEVVWHLNIISIHWEYNQILTSDYDQVHNEVATLTASTSLVIEKTTPHAPSNVTVTRKETFAVTIEWLPGYSGCSHCEQTYKIRWESEIFLAATAALEVQMLVCLCVCVSHLLQLYWTSEGLLKDFRETSKGSLKDLWRTSKGLPKDFRLYSLQNLYKSQPPGLRDLFLL